jgi:hypothetical protein
MPKPTVARTVLIVGGVAVSNGTDVAPAVITRVWNDGLLNVTAFPDGSNQPRTVTSVTLVHDEAAARKRFEEHPSVPTAFWPTIS